MQTKAGSAGTFTAFDLHRVPSPAFVVDEVALRKNLEILSEIREGSGAKILLALKAFAMWGLAEMLDEHLDGYCASGLWEARLAQEKFQGLISTYSPAYKEKELHEIAQISHHVIFNNPAQIQAFENHNDRDIGLRLNPKLSLSETEKYDPSQKYSRLGFPIDALKPDDMNGINGLHIHNLCEQGLEPLIVTWRHIELRIRPYFKGLRWINLGGGHHITRSDYDREGLIGFLAKLKSETGCDIYLEPGEAVALNAGILVGEILDVFDNDMPVAICDVSATCHMPDVLEAPYRPAMLGESDTGMLTRIGGQSCLAGDIIGDYKLPEDIRAGARIAFLDQAHYSMVKTNSFNGVPLPSIWIWNSENDELREVRHFDWTEFRGRLS